MIRLKPILNEILLKEITEKTVLYHRSHDKFNVGDVIDPKVKFGDSSTHWLKSQTSEKALDLYRQKHFPDRPSRFHCIYTSIIPNSAFVGKGILYEVKPVGKFFLTFANYINEINDQFERRVERDEYLHSRKFGSMDAFSYPDEDRYKHGNWDKEFPTYEAFRKAWQEERERLHLEKAEWTMNHDFEKYWNPDPSHNIKVYKKWVEVLCERVKIIAVHGEDSFKFLKRGDKVKLKEDVSADWYRYQCADPEQKLSDEDVSKISHAFKITPGEYNRESLTLPAGTIAEVIVAAPNHTPLPNEYDSHHPDNYKPYRMLRLKPNGYNFYLEVSWALRHPKDIQRTLEKLS